MVVHPPIVDLNLGDHAGRRAIQKQFHMVSGGYFFMFQVEVQKRRIQMIDAKAASN
jgi:hypothetical protein